MTCGGKGDDLVVLVEGEIKGETRLTLEDSGEACWMGEGGPTLGRISRGMVREWEAKGEGDSVWERKGKVLSSKITSFEIKSFPWTSRHLYPLWQDQ